jgi:hypothetical protein
LRFWTHYFFCLINDNKAESNNSKNADFDLGNIGPEARKFNNNGNSNHK